MTLQSRAESYPSFPFINYMNRYFHEGTNKTPRLSFDPHTGIFEISGRSIPENSIEFFRPLITWLDGHIDNNPEGTYELTVKLEYFNTSSSKCLVDIFRRMEKLASLGCDVAIKWFYEADDEDMQDSGLDFKEIVRLPLQMIRI